MKQELIDFGLSEKEADIFLICLKAGEATANRLAELADLPRSTTYDLLEKLKRFGLLTTCVIDKKTHFIASNPEALITTLEDKKQKIKKILPQLKEIQNKILDKPIAEVYQGKIAIISLLDEILGSAKSLKVIGSQGNALQKIDYHPEKFRIKRIENKISVKQLLEVSEESKKIKPDKYTEVRYLKSLNDSKEATFIFGDCVYHLILQHEISAIKVKSQDHANASEILFDELWKKAKPLENAF
jgi:sugar-specific transcriptional regulator TrmB